MTNSVVCSGGLALETTADDSEILSTAKRLPMNECVKDDAKIIVYLRHCEERSDVAIRIFLSLMDNRSAIIEENGLPHQCAYWFAMTWRNGNITQFVMGKIKGGEYRPLGISYLRIPSLAIRAR